MTFINGHRISELRTTSFAAVVNDGNSRDIVLKAIDEGYNTLNALIKRTGLAERIVIKEIHELSHRQPVQITEHPGPPKISYWVRGNEPKGAVYLKDGKIFAVEKADTNGHQIPVQTEPAAKPATEVKVMLADLSNAGIFKEIPLDCIDPHPENPRGIVNTDETSFQNLVDSISAVGVQEPLVVTVDKNTGRFRIVMGHRRFEASKRARLATVPCVIREYDGAEAELIVMLVENIQRQGLQPTQEGKAFHKLYEQSGKDVNAVARKVGLTQSYVISRMRLLKLDIGIQIMIDRRELGVNAGVLLSGLPIEKQRKLVVQAQRMKLSELKEAVDRIKSNALPPPKWKKSKKQVLEPKEQFTRSWALGELEKLGNPAWLTVGSIKNAFNDVCINACLETKDEAMCKACPIPRLVASILRRKENTDNA